MRDVLKHCAAGGAVLLWCSAVQAQTPPRPDDSFSLKNLFAPAPQLPPLVTPQTAPASPAPSAAPQTVPDKTSTAGKVAMTLIARIDTEEGAQAAQGLHWRIFADKLSGPAPTLVAEARDGPASLSLSPGSYLVHLAYGHYATTRRVKLGTEPARETFILKAGGLRLKGVVGQTPIPPNRINFDVYEGSQFGMGEKKLLVKDMLSHEILLLPEGQYHVLSSYGDANATRRTDVQVQSGKLTDASIFHRAAQLTLKLVSDSGGEALANTAWTVLTPGGDSVMESIGAFPVVILTEGDYVAIARHDGKTYSKDFRAESGFDREIEVVATDTRPSR